MAATAKVNGGKVDEATEDHASTFTPFVEVALHPGVDSWGWRLWHFPLLNGVPVKACLAGEYVGMPTRGDAVDAWVRFRDAVAAAEMR